MLAGTEPFFRFLRERESIRLRKEAGRPWPWTENPILREWKFTNVRRYHDRTTVELRNNFYEPNFYADRKDILLNCAIYRYFGTHEFASAVGWRSYANPGFEEIKDIAFRRLGAKQRVFTGAYVITNGGIAGAKPNVVIDMYLKNYYKKIPTLAEVPEIYGWQKMSEFMHPMPGFGGTGFMTKEVLLDTMLTNFWGDPMIDEHGRPQSRPKDYWQWTPVGPGSLRGAARVKGVYPGKLGKPATREVIMELTRSATDANLWPTEWGPLAPTDIQFQLCEFDKHERVRTGEGAPRSRYRKSAYA